MWQFCGIRSCSGDRDLGTLRNRLVEVRALYGRAHRAATSKVYTGGTCSGDGSLRPAAPEDATPRCPNGSWIGLCDPLPALRDTKQQKQAAMAGETVAMIGPDNPTPKHGLKTALANSAPKTGLRQQDCGAKDLDALSGRPSGP